MRHGFYPGTVTPAPERTGHLSGCGAYRDG